MSIENHVLQNFCGDNIPRSRSGRGKKKPSQERDGSKTTNYNHMNFQNLTVGSL
jgi:hypothetical protein